MKRFLNSGLTYLVVLFMILSSVSVNVWAQETSDTADSSQSRIEEKQKNSSKESLDTADELLSNDSKETKKDSSDQESASEAKKTEYTFEDAKIKVKALLKKADAISDQAELKVKEIPENTTEHKKYENALNKKSNSYSNVLLYDISFALDGKEVEPTDGSVKVSMEFKDQQLSNDLKVEAASDLKVIHFKDNDVNKQETLKPTTNVKNETTSFETKSFSYFAITDKNILNENKVYWKKDFVVLNNPVKNSKGQNSYVYYFDDNKMTDSDYEAVGGKENVKLEYHCIDDDSETFTGDSSKTGYDVSRVLGIPGNFHIVAFNKATLSAHTNGNVLTKDLEAPSNFGTKDYGIESSYVSGNYLSVNSNSGSGDDHILAVSNSTNLGFADNGSAFTVNGTKLDNPKVIYKDSQNKHFINMDTVETDITSLSTTLGNMDKGVRLTGVTQTGNTYSLTNPNSVGVINLTASEVSEMGTDVWFDSFESGHNSSIIVNVDMTGVNEVTLPVRAKMKIDGKEVGTNEVVEFSAGKIIWNFVNADNKTINAQNMSGTIIAPKSTVNLTQNINGTIIGANVKNTAETHRSDFTGIIKNDVTAFTVTKKFSNTDWVGNTTYKFKFDAIIDSLGNTKNLPTPTSNEVEVTKDKRTKAFGNINYQYDSAKARKTISYYYKVEEETSNTIENVQYDDNIYYIKVDVEYKDELGVQSATIVNTQYISKKDHKDITENNVTDAKGWTKFDRDNFEFEFKNAEKKLSLVLNKKGVNDEFLNGADFTLTKLNSKYAADGDPINLNEVSGKYKYDNLDYNAMYLVKETKAPDGYFTDGPWILKTDDKSMHLYKAVLSENGKVTGYDQRNEIQKVSSDGYEFNIVDKNSLNLELIKQEEGSDTKLESAEFTLSEVTIENSKLTKVENGYSSDVTTDVNGKANFENLGVNKQYLLEEKKAPSGYNKNGPWIVTVNDDSVNIQKVSIDDNDKVTNVGDSEDKAIDKNQSQLSITETISDTKGAVLPSTGGSGTKAYYTIGTLLSMLCVVYVILKKKKGGLFKEKKNL